MNLKVVLGRFLPGQKAGINDAGWTSVYYIIEPDLSSAGTTANAINSSELALVAAPVTVPFIRIYDLETPRSVNVVTPITSPNGQFPGATLVSGDPTVGLRVRFTGAGGISANKYIRGVPNNIIVNTNNLLINKDATLDAQLSIYAAAVQNVHCSRRLTGAPPPKWQLTPYNVVTLPSQGGEFFASIRRAGRPFVLRHGRRRVG